MGQIGRKAEGKHESVERWPALLPAVPPIGSAPEVLYLLEYDSEVTRNTADDIIAGTVKAAAVLALSEAASRLLRLE